MSVIAPPALYPPTVMRPAGPLSLLQFLRRCIANPLSTFPPSAYEADLAIEEPVKGRPVAWVMAPHLVEQLLLTDSDATVKTEVEHRVFDPILGRGILTSDHGDWKWQRRALAPLFRSGEIATYAPAMSAAAETQIARWRTFPAGATHDVDRDMSAATFDVIVRTMLVGGNPAECTAVMQSGQRYLDHTSWTVALGLLRLPRWLPHPATLSNWRAARRLRSAVSAIIVRREQAQIQATDLLGHLLAARHPDTGAAMSREHIVDNLATLLEAGHETTAKTLAWTLYLLARAPEWQERVREEVRTIAPHGTPLTPDAASRLPVTERVLKESMRLYPPAPVMARTLSRPISIGGREIGAGTQIVIPIFAIHRHRTLWTDPDRFDPDRFLPERAGSIPRGQYMPFGTGPRTCIGQTFALLEAKIMLATLVRGARFTWDGKHLPEPLSRVTLRPKGGMPLGVEVL
ncbi:MAG: cytochrome P450 [Hyphomicrobium sp.]|nr:cytochrome P450 [Hyphomicrobium sp.]